ncbi:MULTISPECIES: pyridoxal 5'-phosphate synthase glutaminase subunit PdxT [Listeria]|uniref:pyridoxal 5'-phosphate synthase glutaminase subunit PdxT n=1 Tax=Listeria TaxID=1637 RepID=UPI000B596782|nr:MULTISPECIES: pyridoxal 5'-phosphate synthase glutaminase subunit PdxT [Listeria]
MKTIGVLALQGAVSEHLAMIEKTGHKAMPIKHPEELAPLDGLILPGGESTTMRRLIEKYHFSEPLSDFANSGRGIFGTCAGLVLSASAISTGDPSFKFADYTAVRNGFGRQKMSFEADLQIAPLGEAPFRAIFIRAPYIEKVGEGVTVLARIDDKIVAAHEKNILVTAFHPELTNDPRFMTYFIEKCL